MNNDKRYKILIVDDSDLNIFVLVNILNVEYDLLTEKDGLSAIETARNAKPDLILLDIVMPGMSGYDILEELKKFDLTKGIPIIIITGLRENKDEEKGLVLGAVDYITKPFSDSIVKLRVKTQIKILEQMRIIEHLSMIDALTGIPNRRYFNNQIESEWRRSARGCMQLGILMIDVDKFKNFNDTYGHTEGDEALKMVAKGISQAMNRSGDFAARWGGEEFIVLLPNTDIAGCVNVAEIIRTDIENKIIHCSDGRKVQITVSIGVNSEIPTLDKDINTFISNADSALYAAKNTGRNKVQVFSIQ